MAAYQGTHFSQRFLLTHSSDGTSVDVTSWLFKAEFRVQVSDTDALLTLTTANGGFTILDAPTGSVRMDLTPVQTALLPVGGLLFDVLRTDQLDGPVFLFSGKIKVKQPVTR